MKTLRCLLTSLAVLILAGAAFAEADPPSRVARLKYVNGQVSIQPGGVDDWVAAAINRPLTTADRVWADRDSRAELNMGSAAMRMNSETSLTLSNLTDGTVQVELNQGTLNLRVARLFKGEIYEVDTPNLAFTILKAGNYRFDVDADGDQTFVTVWNGEGEATGNGSAVRLRSHERVRFEHGNTLAHQINEAPRSDGFDDWCLVRDQREQSVMSSRYVSPDVIGYEDLDEYGSWRDISPYGPVWVPAAVAPGWAPYRFGHWVWIAPWGWTWVDDAPWGFAPFHYGRWVYYSGFWGWCPGPRYVRPYYAPALVAWFGGSHFGVGLSFGGVGWFPLGFGEPFFPYYRASRGYFRNVNVTNTRIVNITNVTNNYYNNSTNITRIKYVNQNVPGATTVVAQRTLVNSEPVAGRTLNIPHEQLRTAAVVQRPDVTPSARTVLGVHAGAATTTPPSRVIDRPVVSKVTPPARPAPVLARPAGDQNGHFVDRQNDGQPQRGGVTAPPAAVNTNSTGNVSAAGTVNKPATATPAPPPTPPAPAASRTMPNTNADRADTTDRPRFPASVPRPPDRTPVMDKSATPNQVNGETRVVPRPPVNIQRGTTATDNTTAPASRTEVFRQGAQPTPSNPAAGRDIPRPGAETRNDVGRPVAVPAARPGENTATTPHPPAVAPVRPERMDAPRQAQESRPVPHPQGNSSEPARTSTPPARSESGVQTAPKAESAPKTEAPKNSAPKNSEPKSDFKQRTYARPPMNSPAGPRAYAVPRPPRPTEASYTVPRPPASQSFISSSRAPVQVWTGSAMTGARSYSGSGYSSRSYAGSAYTSRGYSGGVTARAYAGGGYSSRSYAGSSGGYSRSQSPAGHSNGGGSGNRGGSSYHGGGGSSRTGRAM